MQTPLFRIKPAEPRSAPALASQSAYEWIDVSAVAAARPDRRAREIAASLAHARALEAFLDTLAPFGVVIEDDAILAPNTSWMLLAGYDFFVPFGHNRKKRPSEAIINVGMFRGRGRSLTLRVAGSLYPVCPAPRGRSGR